MDELPIRIAIFAGSVFFAALSASATNKTKHVVMQLPTWKLILGGIATPAFYFILIGGFFFVPWYVALITLLVAYIAAIILMNVMVGIPISREAYVGLFRFGWIFDVFAIAGTATMVVYLLKQITA